MKRIAWALLLALAISMAGALGAGAEEDAQLTLMVYITGSNLETNGGAATADITEMLRSGVDAQEVNILLMTGGARKWWGGFPNDRLCIYRAAGMRPELLDQTDMASMGEADTLSYFLNYCYENCPAKRYALILWDHGGGPLEGVCFDELFNQDGRTDSLSMRELQAALEASPFGPDRPLEWIGFDACLMSAVETANICAPHAKYMIASQETEPGTGWNYSFLRDFGEDMEGDEAGRRIVDSYFDVAAETGGEGLTLACVDLGKIEAVERAMDALFGELDEIISPESFSMLSNSRRDAKNFGRGTTGSDYDLVDLGHLAMQYALIAPEPADDLLAAVDDAVVYRRSDMENSYGLSVYYPYYNKEYFQAAWAEIYAQLDFSQGYAQYLSDYADLWLGEQLADWKGLRAEGLAPRDGAQELTLALTQEQAEHFASAELYILEEDQSGGVYYDIFHMGADAPEGGALRAQYKYQALYALDAQGNPLTDALTYLIMDDTYFVRAVLSQTQYSILNGWEDAVPVYLRCKPDPQSGALRVLDVIELPDSAVFERTSMEDILLSGKQTLTLGPDDWAWVTFPRHPRMRPMSEDGATPAFPDWPYTDEVGEGVYLSYASVDNTAPWTLEFRERQYGGRNLFAQYVVTDTQGGRFASDLLPIENPNLYSRVELNRTLIDDDRLRLTLDAIDVVDAENGSGMYLHMRMDRRIGSDTTVQMRDIRLGTTALDCAVSGGNLLMNWQESMELSFYIPAEKLPPLASPVVDALRFDLSIQQRGLRERVVPVQIDEPIDLGPLAGALAGEPLAEAVDGALVWQLAALEEQEDGSLLALLRIVNGGAEALEISSWPYCAAAVNDCYLRRGAAGETYELRVPAGCDLYARVRFSRDGDASSDAESDFDAFDGFEYWGIDEVRSLTIFPERASEAESGVRLELKAPFPLGESRDAPEAQDLLRAGGLELSLRDVEHDSSLLMEAQRFLNLEGDSEPAPGALRLYLDLRSDAQAPVELGVVEARLDGEAIDANGVRLALETDGYGTSAPAARPGLRQRARILIPLNGADAPERLELSFHWREAEGSWQRSSTAVIELGGGAARATAVAQALPNGPIDAMERFDPELALPADAADCAVTLAAKLPPERVADFASGMVVVLCRERMGSDDPAAYYYMPVCVLEAPELGEDGVLRANFCGMLAYPEGGSMAAMLYETPERVYLRDVELMAESHGEEDARFSSVDLELDAAAGRARIASAACEREIRAEERFDHLRVMTINMLLPEAEDGVLPEIDSWEQAYTAWGGAVEVRDNRARFELRPAADEELFVVFNAYGADGAGDALGPIPYAEAVEN